MSEADGAARIGQPVESDDIGWIKDYRAWRRGRLKRVQDSAGVWLGLLTTLLTLLGSVVRFKGGDLLTSVTHNGWFQLFLILLVSLVFVSAILALIAGGSATWGGLGDIPEEGTAEAKTTAAATLPAPSLAEDNETAGGKTGGLRDLWLRFWLLFSGESKEEREKLRSPPVFPLFPESASRLVASPAGPCDTFVTGVPAPRAARAHRAQPATVQSVSQR